MVDLKFIQSVIDVEVDFNKQINVEKIKYDTYNPFSKFYSLKAIEKVIGKYLNKEVDSVYLSNWFNAYNWILNGGFNPKANESIDELIDLIRNEITWLLDSLSFISKEDDIKAYLESFELLDNILNNPKHWEMFYTQADEEDDEQYVLLVNSIDNIYFEVFSDLFENGDETDKLVYLTNKEYKNKKNLLKALNYEEIEY